MITEDTFLNYISSIEPSGEDILNQLMVRYSWENDFYVFAAKYFISVNYSPPFIFLVDKFFIILSIIIISRIFCLFVL